jgi:hypothetical protein
MLATHREGTVPSRQITAAIQDATNAVIAEAETIGRAALRNGGGRDRGAETFFLVRVARLMTAADQAVDASRTGDFRGVRSHLNHFDTLTSAIFTVRQAVSG